jgi:prepilin-type N-terminal cleavage/methylation domain-containing protein
MAAKNQGFTIVETLIVLAIAGIILMLTFMAIPTLQRNARNNQRKQDINLVLSAVSQWELNNSGNVPQTATSPPDDFLRNSKNKLSYYDPANITVRPTPLDSINLLALPTPDLERVFVTNHVKCNGTGDDINTRKGGYNDVAAIFAIETSGGVQRRCQQL